MSNLLATHQVPSDSNPNRNYAVHIYDTHSACSCPAWKNSSLPNNQRVCKHIEQVTGELRKGDGDLTDAEFNWVIRNLLSVTPQQEPFASVAAAVKRELETNKSLSDYDRRLAGNIITAFCGNRQWGTEDVPGPDAQRALGLIYSALGL